MNFKTNIDFLKQLSCWPAAEPGQGRRFQGVLYWLAGARKATLDQLPESERERIAILGSSVLIPTLLAFLGMYLYASHRFQSPRPLVTLIIALAWAFIIMNVDRILLATYRPFQPLWRKVVQVCFRIGLAALISVAIAFPFCLEQYQGAIKERLQGESLIRLQHLQAKERADQEQIETRFSARREELERQLKQERAKGPTDPMLYAEILAKQAFLQQNDSSRSQQQELEQTSVAAQAEWQRISARIRELEQDVKEEGRGRLSVERGGTGKPGQGAKHKELEREIALLANAERIARQRYEQLLRQAAVVKTIDPPQNILSSLEEQQQISFIAEAKDHKMRIDHLEATIRMAEAERANQMLMHGLQFDPVIKRYIAKAEGSFDPMEETIGLFKVIFVPESDSDGTDQTFRRYKWIAALFQFAIVFGTLFLLDLIAILSKIMSRPGPYDVLVDFPELISTQNLKAIKKQYSSAAEAWAQDAIYASSDLSENDPGNTIDLRNTEEIAQFLLCAHLQFPGRPSSQSGTVVGKAASD